MRSPTHSQERAAADGGGNQGGWMLTGRFAVVSRRAAACAPPNPSWRLHELEDNKCRAVPQHTGIVTQLLLPDRVKRAAWPS